ncbi:uncharacterized protein LOC119589275 [Penaeus monodon]|uniref:uncharacterized protein LOC119589275 n=1 Tax=Penaeus monodon TaxID=6687 RepID=UPI0018A6E0FF|nr:uncharacterized protein LOC119589275 [Penaeus monodon]
MGPQGWILLLLAATAASRKFCAEKPRSICHEGILKVDLPGATSLWLEKERGCIFTKDKGEWTLNLRDCGVKNDIATEYPVMVQWAEAGKEPCIARAKCSNVAKRLQREIHRYVKRDVLPPEFAEPDYIEITSEVTGRAPIPILRVGVRQNGNLVDGEINVRPGTPLTMEVYLDNTSAGTYGIRMSHMEVTDAKDKRETIIFNGCSVDPILFDNFVTTSGDSVSAKFRAFKFPETSYVLFRGTVDVCLDKCQGIACSNGQLGYGRRRRDIDSQPSDPNKIFELTMMAYLKVGDDFNETSSEGPHFKTLRESVEESLILERAMTLGSSAPAPEEPLLIQSSGDEPSFIIFSAAHTHVPSALFAVASAFLLLFYH